MSAILPPIFFPLKGFGKKPNNYWTLHTSGNNAFTIQMNEEMQTSVVGFKNRSDALFIGKMIETHYLRHREWPNTQGGLILPQFPDDLPDDLSYTTMVEWDFEDLKLMCTRNILNMVSVEGLIKTNDGYKFEGNLYSFEAPSEFYQERFEEFMN